MSVSTLSRRTFGVLAVASLLLGIIPAAASGATPEKRDITTFACPADEVPDPKFSDDDGTTAEHRASIACIVWYELAKGRTASTYGVGMDVNRGQMATFIGNLLVTAGVQLSDNPPDAFEDDDDTEHEKRINQLAAIGVVEGDNDGNYNPSHPVRRAAMASFLNRAYEEITGAALTSSEDYFTDDDDAFHEDNINAVAGAGIAAGKTATTYDPAGHVKREQMATFLARETDLLVEDGKITKPASLPADVKLASDSIPQGGKVTGTIDAQDGVEVTGAKVSGCGIQNKTLTLTGDDRAFEFTIPVTQATGSCDLTFTIDRAEGDSVTDVETITVTSGGDRTTAPELVQVAKQSTSGDDVTLRYTFDEALRTEALTASDFRVYTASADQITGNTAQHAGSGAVDVTFEGTDLADVTTATVAANAVEDLQSATNPEGAFPLAQITTEVKGTKAPDLVDVVESTGNVWKFDFDEVIVAHPGTAEDYHLVLDNGDVLDGDTLEEEPTGDEVVDVTFESIPNGRTVARGYVETDTVAGDDDGIALNGVEEGNPTHAEDVKGGGDTPWLVSAKIDATNNKVIYTFNRGVNLVPKRAIDPPSFIAYDLDGNEVGTNDATASGSTVTATFSGNPDPITGSTVGASVRRNAVTASSGTRKANEVDEELVKSTTTASGARGGETSAPDLQSVTRSIDGDDVVLTYTFDQSVARSSDPREPSDGAFAIYQENGDRTQLDLNATSGNECSTEGDTVECRAARTSDLGKLMESAVLGGVEDHAVASSSTASDPPQNYEASAPIV